jgi:TonB family protein
MFETVAPPAFGSRNRWILYETLPLSIAMHALAVGATVVAAVWNVAFPMHSPRVAGMYRMVILPDGPAAPSLNRVPAAPKLASLPVAPAPFADKIVAPSVIPDLTPLADPPPTLDAQTQMDGVGGGTAGGSSHGVAGGISLSGDGRVHVERDKPLPLYVVRRDYPEYPEEAVFRRWEATVVIRYVIDVDGKVKEVTIVEHGRDPMFDEATLKAIREWRFQPLLKDGQPIEVEHELTVYYRIEVR